MERRRPGIYYDEGESDQQQKLHQLFETLEQEWDFIKQRPERGLTRSKRTIGLLNNSSGELMHSLQHRGSLSEGSAGAWKMRTNDLAVEEILTERRAAIESGKLKGRRLFEEEDGAAEGYFGREDARGGCEIGNLVRDQSEVKSVFSYEYDDYDQDEDCGRKEVLSSSCPHRASYISSSSSSSSSSPPPPCDDENVHRGGSYEVGTIAERRIASDVGCGRGRWMTIMGWAVIALVLCIVRIISRRSFDDLYKLDEELILTPT